MEYGEEKLVKQLISGDGKAFEYIYDHYYVFLCRLANEYLNDPFLAEALVGDLIYHLWEIHDTINIKISVRYYLIRAIRNRCINHLKSKHKKMETSFSLFKSDSRLENYEKQSYGYPLDHLYEYELKNGIMTAIKKLPKECRRVFIKSRFDNKTYEEIAHDLGISVNTVKYHMKNALAFIRIEVEHFYRTMN
ncbi:MAG: RNA polymerase sigma-70 factor [Bacteroidales bacterium]|jgi:RNA polymerase sigma-70 factor (ECF subfamily)|nr:RNA polymerase sigma-70 factor [Bacteroidales bacterium]